MNTSISILRTLLLVGNVFVAVYAFTSAGRMAYKGSSLGRCALGAYCITQVVAQATRFNLPPTIVTWLSVPATLAGVLWFVVEVRLSRRGIRQA